MGLLSDQASSPGVAWAEWLRHEEIKDPADLEGIAASLWAVLSITEAAAQARLDQVEQL
ncbi:MAG: hypothetical protein WBM08_00720 [Prochlorococcaceae cyanobacterium]